MSKSQAREKIAELVEKYEQVKNSGRLKSYTEAETCKDFILPLFKALGWDVENKEEVSAEEHTSAKDRSDYGFYLNGWPKFYLEAKKLSANLHDEKFAKQATTYSWNKGIAWAVLTDFENLIVFNSQDIAEHLSHKLFFDIPYKDYLERFDQLWWLSKESFEQDILDEEAEKVGKKLQRVSVTDTLYKDLNKSRELLLKSFHDWNKGVPDDLLEEGVQKLLDRLIFIRVAEDRKLEQNTLTPMLRAHGGSSSEDFYKDLVSKFRELDSIYNSNLFAPHPVENWQEYDGATGKVIESLHGEKGYYEYNFEAIPADILGSVYENYLGYKLSQSSKGIAVAKDARKRKEQGIYYTPTYIVDYIVTNALKPALDKCESVEDLKAIKVLDPACGSGSFLIRALEMIYDKYLEFGANPGEMTKVTILLDNIFGVDLDEQAVEIARLNLLINALDSRMKLPDLSANIKNGNSLISGTDQELEKYFGKDYRNKKPFNWQEEFPQVFDRENPGFDVIIGNPPYIFARGGSFSEEEKKYYYGKYKLQQYQINTFSLFIELAYTRLRKDGNFGFIIPNNWLTISSFSGLREFLLKNVGNLSIINSVDTVFGHASVDTCILTFQKSNPSSLKLGELRDGEVKFINNHAPDEFYSSDYILKIANSDNSNTSLKNVFEKCVPLGEIAAVKSGLKAYEVGKGIPAQTQAMKDSRVYHSETPKGKDWIKYLDGVDVARYRLGWSGEYIKYGKNLAAARKPENFTDPRILVRQIPSKPPYCINAAYTDEHYINDLNSNNILNPSEGYSLKYILGVINSRLLSYWFINTFDKFQRKIFPQFKVNELARFPIFPANKNQQEQIEKLVNKILDLKKELNNQQAGSNKNISLQSEIEKTDRQIDRLVYELYGLNPEEIKTVERVNNVEGQ